MIAFPEWKLTLPGGRTKRTDDYPRTLKNGHKIRALVTIQVRTVLAVASLD